MALALALGLCAGPLNAGDGRGVPFTEDQYRAAIQAILTVVPIDDPAGLANVLNGLPSAWRVKAGGSELVVSTDWLRADLRALQSAPNPDVRASVERRLHRLLTDIDQYDAAPRDHSTDRRKLAAILQRPEFSAVHGPTWFDRLKREIANFLVGLVERIFGSSSFPVVAAIVVYVLLGLAVLVTGLWVYRTLAGERAQPVVPQQVSISAKAWTVWLSEARDAAARGEWRDAVRLAYWAGISFLESRGVWPPDRARTPREYLRLLPAANEHRAALSSLTRTFEPVWYGNRTADATTFGETVAQLERLGAMDHTGQTRHAVPAPDDRETR